MDLIWSYNGAPEFGHFFIAIYFAFGFVFARFFLDNFMFRRLAIWSLSSGADPVKICEAKQAKIVKISESLWKLTYYAVVQVSVLTITYREPWFKDTQGYLRGWPNQELKFTMKLFYMCQCGFYIYSIAALITWETRRKDFSIMMSHHIITTILIGYSYLTRFFRIGSIILALHDTSDVFLEAAKIFKYSEREFAASLLFGFFALSWLILRLIFFPFWLIKTSCYDVCELLTLSDPYLCLLYYMFNTMLLTLLVFHIYWWILISSMVLRQLKNRGKVGEDIRSDSEDED
ncbi:ceramide synthase LOH2-like [Macadamia integrifolia]|uniref:ceramide synthase LOH2-like n=1 Tax=Macadamia integrifolia TaxID=60698 RepID=UPI001C4EAD6A|nr:ceramide synthase LOH2-like [Macadamia integrifolia]